jgi:hypothetical protein
MLHVVLDRQKISKTITGSSDFDKILKIALLHVVLDWQNIYKTILEKAFF